MTTYIPSITIPSAIFESAAAAILLPVAAGTAIGFSSRPKKTQNTYMALRQPPLRPPPWVFGPAWTTLYGLMGYASYRAYNTGMSSLNPTTVALTKQGMTLYSIQLALNLIWMPLFFGYQRPMEATVDILALTATTGYLTYIWSHVDEVASWCLVPYVAWLGFATYLTIGVGYLNNWDISSKEVPKSGKGKGTKYVDERP